MKKFLSILLVLLLTVGVFPTSALAENDEKSENMKKALASLSLRISDKKEETKDLIKVIEKIDGDNNINIIGSLFDAFNENEDLEKRLNNLKVDKYRVSAALETFRKNDGYSEILKVLDSDESLSENEDFSVWASKIFDEIFKNDYAPLNDFYSKAKEKFGTYNNFASFVKKCESIVKGRDSEGKDSNIKNIKIKYTSGDLKLEIADVESLVKDIEAVFSEFNITPLKQTEVETLIGAINDVLDELSSEDAIVIGKYLRAHGYEVEGLPADEEEPIPDEGDSDGGGTIGGTGGGGGTSVVTTEPKVNVPEDKTKPVTIAVPSEAAKIEIINGKATVSFDEKQVEKLLKLIDEAVAKADGREVALTIDLSDNSKVAEGATVELPVSLVAKAFEKGVAMTVNFKALGIDIPEGAFDVKGVENLKLVVEKKNAVQVPQNMRQVGNAYEISLLADEKPVSFNKKVTLRFSIKGLATNIDKLGVYYLDVKTGKTEFVGGKVDRAKAEVIAKLSHFSTYALFEYYKTFTDITNHWAKAYIESMAAKRVVDGRTEDKFVPNDGITRAEFVKLMVTALELDLVPYKGSFEDVKSDAWYADYVQTAYENGIITGRVEGKVFDPNAKIMRQEIMAMVGRALGKQAIRPVDALLASFKDADKVAQYAKEHAALLVELGIVGGYPDGTLRPRENTTRAEAVKLIYGLYNNF